MNRRDFVAILGASVMTRVDGTTAPETQAIKAVAFDAFVIFDLRAIAEVLSQLYPQKSAEILTLWRTRQFEYTWLRTLTNTYVDFWQVTEESLRFACRSAGIVPKSAELDRLMEVYLRLPVWPDVHATLRKLKESGIRLAFLSNFTRKMLDDNVRHAGLESYFEEYLTTDNVRAFKPDTRSYQMGTRHFAVSVDEIVFAAFAAWDVAGAKRFGYPVYWCNRLGQLPEELGATADRTAADLSELPNFAGLK